MLKNRLKVLLQRVYSGGRKPKNIIMSSGLREALRMEMRGSVSYIQNTFPKEDLFHGIPVVVANEANEPMIQLEPIDGPAPKEAKGLIIPDRKTWE